MWADTVARPGHAVRHVTCSMQEARPSRPLTVSRRRWLSDAASSVAAAAGLLPLLQASCPRPAVAEPATEPVSLSSNGSDIQLLDDQPGTGTAAARMGDLVLVHYVGTLADNGALFDSTRGGAMYRDGGRGALRPTILRLGGPPMPGICTGLQQGIQGMRVGGRRTFQVPASLGFGQSSVLGPYGAVPGSSTLQYEVELLRLSRRGPDALMSGVSQCGGGFASERTAGCGAITPAEFL